ncbi:MAG: NUDIX domain-containing protein [Chloroflexi bacterium]|nr:NUDIX domain-containing protein [Chloroflexota bacterium]
MLTKLLYTINKLRWRITKPITLGVRLLLIRDSKILLVKHTYTNYWYLAGGAVEKNETLEQAARREAQEEIGAQLKDLTLFGVYSNFKESKSDHIVLFTCNDFTVTGTTNREIASFEFFDLEKLPEDISPATRRRIHEYLSCEAKPSVAIW